MFEVGCDGVSYIMAGYNESDIIEKSVLTCYEVLSQRFQKFEIILVDDGSKDDTTKIMERLADAYPEVRVLKNYINLNFAISVLRGIASAKYEYITYNAADLPLNPQMLPELLDEMGEADLMVLEREEYKPRLWRRMTSSVNKVLIKMFFPRMTKGISTFNFIQIFKKERLPWLMPLARSPIFAFAEMIIRARSYQMKVCSKSVPCELAERAGAFGKPHDIFWGVYEMLRFRMRKWFWKEQTLPKIEVAENIDLEERA